MKISKNSFFIFLCNFIILIFLLVLLISIKQLEESYIELNNQNTRNVVYITHDENITCEEYRNELYSFFEKVKEKENIILKVEGLDIGFENSGSSIGIYFSNEINNFYSILEGRGFSLDDIKNKRKVVLIGKSLLPKCLEKNGKKYLIRGKDEFEVIGIVGKDGITTQYDEYVIYNLTSLIYDIRQVELGAWSLDSLKYSGDELNKIIQASDLSGHLQGKKASEFAPSFNPLKETLNSNKNILITFGLIIITIILALIQAIFYWIKRSKLEMGIRRTYGATNFNIVLGMLKNYYIVTFSAMILALIFIYAFSTIFNMGLSITDKDFIKVTELIFIANFILGIFPFISTVYVLKHDTIVNMLKEGTS